MMDVAPTVSAVLRLPAPAHAKGAPIRAIVADLAGARRLAILALDALGTFAWNLWRGRMLYLDALHERRSVILRSVMPSITPVNFATMVTGTDLAGHGANTLNDAFACETLFDVVRRAGGKSAGVGLHGYTGCELLGRFADIRGDAGNGTDDDVAEKIIEIAGRDQPEFLIAQLGRVDDVFHQHGPSSPAVVPMLQASDKRLGRLVKHLQPLEYGVLIVADHGQHDMPDAPAGEMQGSHGSDRDEDCLTPCTWVEYPRHRRQGNAGFETRGTAANHDAPPVLGQREKPKIFTGRLKPPVNFNAWESLIPTL